MIRGMNPFKYGTVVSGRYFINRQREIARIKSDLLGGNNIILYSPRRYGKTSLILKVLAELKGQGIKTAYLDFYQVFSQENFIQLYASRIMEAMGPSLQKAVKRIKASVRGIMPSITFDDSGKPVLSFSYSANVPREYSLLDALDLPKKVKGKDEKWVIVLDEFQEINRLNGETMEKQFRSVLQFHDDIGYVFMGSKTHLMLNLFADKKRAFYNIGKIVKLDKISPEEMIDHIGEEFSRGGLALAEGILEKILDYTDNIPYYNQFLASQVWQLAREEGLEVDETTVEKAVSLILDNQSDYYHTLFDQLTIYQRKVLHALVHQKESIFSREYAEKFGLSSVSSTQRALNSLMEAGIIEKLEERFGFCDPFFPLYLRLRTFA